MLVVADTTPINILVRIDAVGVLLKLFEVVLIPPQVEAELMHERTPRKVREFMMARPAWLVVESPKSFHRIRELDVGEEQAINLAESCHANALLIDEKLGRRIAAARGLRIIGTVGVLELAAVEGLIDLREMANRLLTTDFHIDQRIVSAALERDAARRRL